MDLGRLLKRQVSSAYGGWFLHFREAENIACRLNARLAISRDVSLPPAAIAITRHASGFRDECSACYLIAPELRAHQSISL